MQSPRRKAVAVGLGALLVAIFAIVAVAQGIGHPSPEGDAIAIVEDAVNGEDVTITRAEFDDALAQTAARQGIEEPPAEDDPQYELLRDTAIADLLLGVWVRGEAEDRDVDVTPEDVEEQLDQIVEQQFEGRQRQFENFLEESALTEEQALERVELQMLSDQIQGDALPTDPDVSEDEIEQFYEQNPEQFEQPETRNARVIQTEEAEEAQEARERLEEDDSPRSWRQVAEDLSVDQATAEAGGLRQGMVEGQSEQALDEQIFTSAENELVGPFEGEAGHYVIRVEEIVPAQTVSLEDAREQIRQAIAGQRQQQIAQDFQVDFLQKWVSRTYCAEGFRIDRCANADPLPTTCPEEVAEAQGCPAPVQSNQVIEPGTAVPFGEAPMRPQGPLQPEPEQPEIPEGLEGLPPDLEQIPEPPPGEGAPPPPAPEEAPPPPPDE